MTAIYYHKRKLLSFEKFITSLIVQLNIIPYKIEKRVKPVNTNNKRNYHDFYGLRYVVLTDNQCFKIWEMLIKSINIIRVKDYYNNPHPANPEYKAIHLNIKLGRIKNIEVQIRTLVSHERSNYLIEKLGNHYWRNY